MFSPSEGPIGIPYEGEAGRWFVRRPNGRVVPCPTPPSKTRRCTSCNQIKSTANFSTQSRKNHPNTVLISSHCKECKRIARRKHVRTPRGKYLDAKNIAERRGFPFVLNTIEYSSIISLPCHYCQGLLPETGMGLDRIDHTKGYINDNVLPCCDNCNRTRSDVYSVKDMLIIGAAIRQVRELHGGIVPKSAYGRGRPRIKDES